MSGLPIWAVLRRWLIAGLAVWVPLGVTLLVVHFLIDRMDRSLLLLPEQYRPETLLGFNIPGLGTVLTIVIVLLTGFLAANYFGGKLLGLLESMLSRLPLVRSLYGGMKSLSDTILTGSGNSFRKVLLIEYPRKGIWTLAFQTGEPVGEILEKTGAQVVTVFVPTTPNPTSGFIVMVPKEDAIEMDMSVEQALRMIMSLGVVTPDHPDIQASIPKKS